ncbi:MAG: hypothetical protein ABIA67_02520 [Candidatus Margulisiibacteriota bacterium]
MRKKIFAIIIFIALLNNLAFSAASDSSLIDLVKSQKNKLKVPCSMLPEIIERSVSNTNNKMSQKRNSDISYEWSVSRTSSEDAVLLSFVVVTHVSFDTVTMSYSWEPRFAWVVDSKQNKVVPANYLTRSWMETGRLQKP